MDSAAILAICAGVSSFVTLVLQGTVYYKLRRRPLPDATPEPAVSILKPLKGVDAGLRQNLEAFAKLDYPEFELVFGVEEADDPAVALVRAYQKAHPLLPTRLVIGSAALGFNPKVNNLGSLTRAARHPVWLISDADVRPAPNYLREIVADLGADGVGLVHSVLGGSGERTTGALFESLQLNSFAPRAICGADVLLAHPCVIGKSMLFRKEHLEEIGGFQAVANYLAEDYVLGQRFAQSGLRVALSRHVVRVVNPERTLESFINRQVRWGQMRRRVSLSAYLGEALLNPCLWLMLYLVALSLSAPEPSRLFASWALVTLGVFLKCAADARLTRELTGQALPFKNWAWIPMKDVLMGGIWLVALFRTQVLWRGNVLRIGTGTELTLPLGRATTPASSAIGGTA